MRVSRDPADVATALAQMQRGRPKASADGFDLLAAQCRLLGLPAPVAEYRFHPTRQWRFDACWVDEHLALEIEGVVYVKGGFLGGRHVSASGFRGDTLKYGEAFALGWTVLRCLPEQVTNGHAVDWIKRRLLLDRRTQDQGE